MRSWPAIAALTSLVLLTMFAVHNLTQSVDQLPGDDAVSYSEPSRLLQTQLATLALRFAKWDEQSEPSPGENLRVIRNTVKQLDNSSEESAKSDRLLIDRLLADLDQIERLSLPVQLEVTTESSAREQVMVKLRQMQNANDHELANRRLSDESAAREVRSETTLHSRWALVLLGLVTAGLLALALQQWRGFRSQNIVKNSDHIRLKDALEGLPDGCVVLNREREITAHNKKLTKLLPDSLDLENINHDDRSIEGVRAEALYGDLCLDNTMTRDALTEWLDNLHADETSSIELLDHRNRHLLIRERPTGNGDITATIRDISDSKQAALSLQEATDYDSLTSLPNRVLFMRELREHARNTDLTIALAICDLRNFRQINDSYGQDVGDRLLIKIADCLQEEMPERAVLSRLAGDEFAIMLQPAADKNVIESAIQVFLDRMKQGFSIGNRLIPVRASIGIAYGPEHGLSPVELKNAADSACSEAKRKRSTNFNIFDRQYQADADRVHMIDIGLIKAIENDELQIEYQPQIDIKTNLTAGMEALLRWDSPELGRVSPAEFIPCAERSGLISDLGDWVLTKAISDYQRLSKFVTATGTLSVNLSRKQFDNPGLIFNVERMLEKTGMKPEELTLEITETAILDDRQRAREVLTELHCLGVNLSIDDFGVGYSSLLELRDFPINEVKIDRSFVVDVVTCLNSQKIIQAIVNVAEAIGAEVVAEGIENRTQFEWIRKLGCTRAQGYFLCEPMSATTFPDVVLGGGDKEPV